MSLEVKNVAQAPQTEENVFLATAYIGSAVEALPESPVKRVRLGDELQPLDAYVERVIQQGGIFYRLMFVHRYTGKQFSQTSLSRIEPAKEEVMALRDMLQRYMDISQPLPDIPKLEPFRHLDPVTAKHDQRTGRNPRYWRDLNLEAWKQAEGAEWLKRQAEYPWAKRRCRLTPQLGKVSMQVYREQRPQGAYSV